MIGVPVVKKLRVLFVFAVLLCSITTATAFAESTVAADTSKFSAGRIIDDQVFFDSSGLSAAEVQNFLNSKVPVCDTNGSQPYGGTTRAAFSASRGYYPPFTCLKNYVQDIGAKPADSFCKGYPQSRKTAAEIIQGVAESCGINPRVLIVLLQKEQGLITDDWPWSLQYRSATGYGCPDSTPGVCDSAYYGFFNQVYNAARQFKRYAALNSEYGYRAYRNNTIQWSPTASCGSSTVYIENLATSGLYNYTPYRPNQAALNAGYGTGDGCSAYGNRNFWLYYTDWFGSTSTPNYRWTPHQQMSFTEGSASTAMPTTGRIEGDRVYLIVKVKNAGASTWYKGQVNLALSNPTGRSSAIYDSSWPSANRPAYFYESSVPPGGEATYGFWANLTKSGTYREYFNLVADGITWLNDMGMYYEFQVEPARYTAQYNGQATYTDQTKTTIAPTSDYTTPNTRYYNVLRMKNTGNMTWKKGFVNLATSGPTDRTSAVHDSSWISKNRIATFSEPSVAPGETATFEFWSNTPASVGQNREYVNLVAEYISWFTDYGIHFSYQVNQPYSWLPAGQSAFTDQSASTPKDLTTMTPGERAYLEVKLRNTGTATWKKNYLNLGTSGPTDRASVFRDSSWLSTNRAATLAENTVAPGEIGTFRFWVTAPNTKKSYQEYFNPVAENVTWLTNYGLHFNLRVQ